MRSKKVGQKVRGFHKSADPMAFVRSECKRIKVPFGAYKIALLVGPHMIGSPTLSCFAFSAGGLRLQLFLATYQKLWPKLKSPTQVLKNIEPFFKGSFLMYTSRRSGNEWNDVGLKGPEDLYS